MGIKKRQVGALAHRRLRSCREGLSVRLLVIFYRCLTANKFMLCAKTICVMLLHVTA